MFQQDIQLRFLNFVRNDMLIRFFTWSSSLFLNKVFPGYYTNLSVINFSYTPSDSHTILNCSLVINNAINDTNSSVVDGNLNNFTATSFAEGSYSWGVNCTGLFGYPALYWSFLLSAISQRGNLLQPHLHHS